MSDFTELRMSIDQLIDDVIARESGYVNDPDDAGSATKYGITKATLARWRNRHVTVADVRALEMDEARLIYREQYVVQPGLDKLPAPLMVQLVDFGVHSGTATAIRMLQRVLDVTEDGLLGPVTLHAIERHPLAWVVRRVWQERVRYLSHLVAMRPTQKKFLSGWLNRCFELQP